MRSTHASLETLWDAAGFKPDSRQEEAIRHVDGPLFLPAGPGSGKTRVLLWRALNLVVFHNIPPEAIYLSTFTEKAALQLREGLCSLLGLASSMTDKPYDIAPLYVGTVHSLCRRLLLDRRFYPERQRGTAPLLLDELGQYFYLYDNARWSELTHQAGFDHGANVAISRLFDGYPSVSRHSAVTNCIALFNRLSEECLDPEEVLDGADHPVLRQLVLMYAAYRGSLHPADAPPRTDFSLLQQDALHMLETFPGCGEVFHHVIIDEYQDTNTVQERLFFRLAAGHKNLCVVGDDDQALYRFRGATVENLVEFPTRCYKRLKTKPLTIVLNTNYRSCPKIVSFYSDYMDRCDWRKPRRGHYRVMGKEIGAHRREQAAAVVASTPNRPDEVCAEIADLVCRLLQTGRVADPNQIAFLFPSLKPKVVQTMKQALEQRGLSVYAPRAGRFLQVEEAVDMLGLYMHILGRPEPGSFGGRDYEDYYGWVARAYERGQELRHSDKALARFVKDRQREIADAVSDYHILGHVAKDRGWDLPVRFDLSQMMPALAKAPRLSRAARRNLGNESFIRSVRRRQESPRPFTLNYVLTSVTALDWSILDLFYRLCGFDHFRAMFDRAERSPNKDEGPVCNLGLLSQYLARFMDEQRVNVIRASLLDKDGLVHIFFGRYLFALFRRGESEYEDAEDPFPRGRIPFLTIHQAKGLEFPVVVLGNPRKKAGRPQRVEELVHPFLERSSEPLDRMSEFDTMRLFYVALSRAKNLLVIAHYRGAGQSINEPFKSLLTDDFPRIPNLDVGGLPPARLEAEEMPRSYSYTVDYLFYQKCPRQYMIFRRYGFVPARSQTQVFGSLVHHTLEDLHQLLIARRSPQ